jgi:(R,R)-butanediol dehydrogenase/meso-butanediol dehydrogenase/diacetyl reductase
MIPLAASFVRPRGTVIVLGSCFAADPLVPGIIQLKEIRIQFAVAYTLREFQVCVDTLDGGSVEPRAMITDSVSLDDLPEAFDALRRRTTQCKVIVDPQAH